MSAPSPRWVGTLLAFLLVALGAAAFAWTGARAESAGLAPAGGSFWTATGRDGRPLAVRAGEAGVVIGPGDVLRLRDADGPLNRLRSLTLRLQRTGTQSSYARLHFRDQGTALYRAVVLPGPSVTGALAFQEQGQPAVELARQQVAGLPDDRPFRLALLLDGPRLRIELNGEPLLVAEDDRLAGGSVSLFADGLRVLSVAASGEGLDAAGAARPFDHRDVISAPTPDGALAWDVFLKRAAWALAVALAAAGWLAALCRGAPGAARLLRATLLFLSPAAALFLLAAFSTPSPAQEPAWELPRFALLLVLAAALGPLAACFVLRDAFSAPRRTGGRRRAALVVLLLALLAGLVAGRTRSQALAPFTAAARVADRAVAAAPQRVEQAVALDAGNALTLAGPWRSFTLRARLVLAPGSLVEIRSRAAMGLPEGVALFLSTDEACRSGFVREGDLEFQPIGEDGGAVAAGVPLALELRAKGADFSAAVDGRRIASARELRSPSGAIVLLAAKGSAVVERVEVEPVPAAAPADAPAAAPGRGGGVTAEAVRAGASPAIWLLLVAALAGALLALPLARAAEGVAWALLPFVAALHFTATADGRLSAPAFWGAAVGGAAMLVAFALAQARGLRPWRPAAMLLLALAAAPALPSAAAGAPAGTDDSQGFGPSELSVAPMRSGLVHVQHPLVRRYNTYLIDHRFRGRSFRPEKPEGVERVLALGSSSTWGHGIEESTGLDYPTILEGLLAERMPGQPVQVVNAAVRGSTSARLLAVLREVGLGFEPDLVTLSLYYNDAMALSVLDEGRYFRRVSAPDYRHSLLDRFETRWERFVGARALARLFAAPTAGPGGEAGAWSAAGSPEPSPPERFAANLRAIASLLRERGVALVLVKEPLRGDIERVWKHDFYAVLDAIGAEFGAPVLDPRPALQAAGGAALFMDQIHPLPSGNQVIAEQLAPVVAATLAARRAAR